MKKSYSAPTIQLRRITHRDMIVTSEPFGPNGEGIDFGGEGGDEMPAPRPSSSRSGWDAYNK